MPRKLDDWVQGYQELCAPKQVPPLYAEWAALSTMSSFIQRRYWYYSWGKPTYPTLFVILVGEPAVGKGIAMEPAEDILHELPGQNIAADSMTVAALADEFKDPSNAQNHAKGAKVVECIPVTVISKELQVFLPEYSPSMLGRLISLWDLKGYSERTRKEGEKLYFPNAHLTMIAGTTPSFMASLLPEQAWEGGFMSRCITVYHSDVAERLFQEEAPGKDNMLFENLVNDAKVLMSDMGPMRWAEDAIMRMHEWAKGGRKPVQTHPKMLYYNQRRDWNLQRMSLLYALSRGECETIGVQDFERALNTLVATEEQMVEIFKALKTGGDEQIMKETHHFVLEYWTKKNKPVPKPNVMRFLNARIQSFRAESLLEAMLSAEILESVQVNKTGVCYKPKIVEFN